MTLQRVADRAGIAVNTVSNACKGERVLQSKAEAIAKVLGKPLTKLFILSHDSSPLSGKTILESGYPFNTPR